MYEIDGDFGKVRHVRIPPGKSSIKVPFQFTEAGWHRCNELYHWERDGSQEEHLLLFSVSDGGMFCLKDREPMRLPASSVAWLPAKCKHAYYTAPGEIWEFYWIHLESLSCLSFDSLFDENSLLQVSDMDLVRQEFERFFRNIKIDAGEFWVESFRMLGALYYFFLQEKLDQTAKDGKNDCLIHEIIRQMQENCAKEWKLEELSAQYFISVPQLLRRFKAETNMTPHAYLLTLRIHEAEMLLKYTNQTVEEIGKQVGFSTTSNFILQFRNLTGTSPGMYRRSMS